MFTDLTPLLAGDGILSVPYKTKNIRPLEKLFIGRLTDLSQPQAPKATWLWWYGGKKILPLKRELKEI